MLSHVSVCVCVYVYVYIPYQDKLEDMKFSQSFICMCVNMINTAPTTSTVKPLNNRHLI